MTNSQFQNPLMDIWKQNYPFEYWDNRIEKINRYNRQDKLETLFILSHLTDVYFHVLAAKLRNPSFPWFMVKEGTLPSDIKEVRRILWSDDESRYTIKKVLEQPEELVNFELPKNEETDLSTVFASEFLGCPAQINEEVVKPLFDPDSYIEACNEIVNFKFDNKEILNDFKHGFRILPFHWGTVRYLMEYEDIRIGPNSIEGLKQKYEAVDSDWTFDFWRMKTMGEDPTRVILEVRTVDIEKCKLACKGVLKLLFNLFHSDSGLQRENKFGMVPLGDEKLELPIIKEQFSLHTFLESTP